MKRYMAILSDGKNTAIIFFNSIFKANTKYNFMDCKQTLIKEYDIKFCYKYKIKYTVLISVVYLFIILLLLHLGGWNMKNFFKTINYQLKKPLGRFLSFGSLLTLLILFIIKIY